MRIGVVRVFLCLLVFVLPLSAHTEQHFQACFHGYSVMHKSLILDLP